DASIHYQLTGGEWQTYNGPFKIRESQNIRAYSELKGFKSATVESRTNAIDHNYTIELFSEYSNQYHAGGVSALIDGIEGYPNFKTGEWQGYYGNDVEIVLDLQKAQRIDSLSIGCLQDTKPWIMYPSRILVEFSDDGRNWIEAGSAENHVTQEDEEVQIQKLTASVKGKSRFIRLTVKNPGKLPNWHLGAGNPSWMFLDEINVHLHE
ncbi:MAG: discoidin domain-containing protein, partial [Flavobacteriales bacterium]